MTGQENGDLLIQVTAWAGLTNYIGCIFVIDEIDSPSSTSGSLHFKNFNYLQWRNRGVPVTQHHIRYLHMYPVVYFFAKQIGLNM